MSIGGVSCEVAACIHLRELTTGTRPLFRRTIDLATFCAELSDAKLTTWSGYAHHGDSPTDLQDSSHVELEKAAQMILKFSAEGSGVRGTCARCIGCLAPDTRLRASKGADMAMSDIFRLRCRTGQSWLTLCRESET